MGSSSSAPTSEPSTGRTPGEQRHRIEADVAILGGGIAGLTLAIQLSQADPDLRVCILERRDHPVPEATHKVGESSVEVQAHYLRNVLGLEDHLNSEQLHKFGLRLFLTHDDNSDLARRVEYGQITSAPLPAYQLDRGRLENYLGQRARSLGVQFLTNHPVRRIDLGSGETPHQITATHGATEVRIEARWVVDGSGRAGLLKRKLGLAAPLDHHANASWLRIAHEIDVDTWSVEPEWRNRVPCGLRRLSTNHLMGPHYWVWLIPLASGSTSVGIVADAAAHPHDGFNTLDRALDWLERHEPQCAAEIRAHQDRIQDFRVMRDYCYGATQVYSSDRWCLTGEAGVSIDPLYSSGGDLMAISNGLITDLVLRDRRGEDLAVAAVAHNQLYLLLSQIWLVAYRDLYEVLGNPQVVVAKVIWDTIIYWAVPGLLYFHDRLKSLADDPVLLAGLYRTWEIHTRVQQFFREWNAVENQPAQDVFADPYSLMDFLVDLHTGMAAGLPDDQLAVQVAENVALLEHLAGQLMDVVAGRLADSESGEAQAQAEAWRADREVDRLVASYLERDPHHPVDPAWISLGHHSPEPASAGRR